MKWKDVKKGTLIILKNNTGRIEFSPYDFEHNGMEYKYILILSDVLFEDAKKSRDRKFYFKAAFYDDMEEKTIIHKFYRSDMRSFMKIIDDNKMVEKIEQECFMEEL